MKKTISRRKFIKKSSAGLAGAAIMSSSALSYGRILGSNDTIQMAIIGIRGRGHSHMRNFAKMKNVRLKYLVDVDENLFKSRLDEAEKLTGFRPQTKWDMRRVFDDQEIDAVSVATPNHWHALSTIWAAQAGKHVYVEKPSSHNVFEGRKMIEASDKYGVLVQVGFQNRSILNTNRAIKFIRDGKLGEIYMTRGLCFKPRASIGKYPDGAMKAGEKFRMNLETNSYQTPYTEAYLKNVHYNQWLGPAPERAFNRNRFHYNWHWHWDYGNGDTGNQGPHQFDVARWALGKDELPVRVNSMGGYFAYKNSAQETPNTQTSMFEYADGKILEFGTRGLFTNPEGTLLPDINITGNGKISATSDAVPVNIGTIVLGTEGWMQIDSGGNWQTFFGRKNDAGPTSGEKDDSYNPMDLTGGGGSAIFDNFISAIRNNDRNELTCDIKTGHMSTVLPLIANVAYRVGRELKLDGKEETFIKDKEANKMLKRDYRKDFTVPNKV